MGFFKNSKISVRLSPAAYWESKPNSFVLLDFKTCKNKVSLLEFIICKNLKLLPERCITRFTFYKLPIFSLFFSLSDSNTGKTPTIST